MRHFNTVPDDFNIGFPLLQSLPLGLPGVGGGQYARGRLALPEMLAQFEREADLEDE